MRARGKRKKNFVNEAQLQYTYPPTHPPPFLDLDLSFLAGLSGAVGALSRRSDKTLFGTHRLIKLSFNEILHKIKLQSTGAVLRGQGGCNINLSIKKGPGGPNTPLSDSKLFYPFNLEAARKTSKNAPYACTNIPSHCPECNQVHWKYNFAQLYQDQYHTLETPYDFMITEQERCMLKAKFKSKFERKFVAIETDDREARKVQSSSNPGEKR